MKKILILIPVALVAACSSAPKEIYERRAYDIQQEQRRDRETAVEKMPRWFKQIPVSKDAVYAVGEAEGATVNWSLTKAKQVAYGEICMAAGGKVDQQTKLFRSEVGGQMGENSNSAIRSLCPGVDITGVETVGKIDGEDGIIVLPTATGFRTYVLVALPTGPANRLQERKDKMEAGRQATVQAQQAFRELDANKRQPTQ